MKVFRWEASAHPPEDGSLGTEASVICPHCGEQVVIGLDPGGGMSQQYVEDCQVCCRPWHVSVSYDVYGTAVVRVDPSQ